MRWRLLAMGSCSSRPTRPARCNAAAVMPASKERGHGAMPGMRAVAPLDVSRWRNWSGSSMNAMLAGERPEVSDLTQTLYACMGRRTSAGLRRTRRGRRRYLPVIRISLKRAWCHDCHRSSATLARPLSIHAARSGRPCLRATAAACCQAYPTATCSTRQPAACCVKTA